MYKNCKKDEVQKYVHDRYCFGIMCPKHDDIHSYNIKKFIFIFIVSVFLNLLVSLIKKNILFYTFILNVRLVYLIISFDILMLFYSHYSKDQYVLCFMIIFNINNIFSILYNTGNLFLKKDKLTIKFLKKNFSMLVFCCVFIIIYYIIMLNYLVSISNKLVMHVVYFTLICCFIVLLISLLFFNLSPELYSKTFELK